MSHLARVVGTDGDAKISLDECVVDQVSHIFERFPIVFTDTVTKLQLKPKTTALTNKYTAPFSFPSSLKHSSPPVEVRLAKTHHEQWHLKCCQDQKHLGEERMTQQTIRRYWTIFTRDDTLTVFFH